MSSSRGLNRLAGRNRGANAVARPALPLPASIAANPSMDRPISALEPEAAVAIWDAVRTTEGPLFFKDYPRDGGRTGVFDDEEKVRMVREVLTSDMRDFDGNPEVISRAQVVRDAAEQRGFTLPTPRSLPKIPSGSLEILMAFGMTLIDLVNKGELKEENFDSQPGLWLHGAKSPLTGEPARDRAFVRSLVAWARSGFPRVILASHRIAASMMWIDATRGLNEAHAPWEAFWVSIPNNLVRYDEGAATVDVTEGFVHVRPSGAVVARFGDSTSLGLQILRPSLATLGNPGSIPRDWARVRPA